MEKYFMQFIDIQSDLESLKLGISFRQIKKKPNMFHVLNSIANYQQYLD